jgi:hypothetical protein
MRGGATKPESYCKITVYLQHNAPLLHENIQDLCLFGLFNARGNSGVTFLLPDVKTQGKIDKLVGTDAQEAVNMITACVLPVYMSDISDFNSQKDDIPNKMGHKLPIKGVTSSSVELSNGAKITRDSKFKSLYKTSNIAVFLIDGEVPTTGENTSIVKKKKGSGRSKYKGGNDSDFNKEDRTIGNTWSDHVKEAGLITIARLGRSGGIDHLTHLTISLLNFMINGGDKSTPCLKKLGELLVKVMPVSPLYCLFIFPLMSNDELTRWINSPLEYNKFTRLNDLLSLGLNKHKNTEYTKVKSRENVVGLNATSICEHIIGHAKELKNNCLGTTFDDVIEYRFKGNDGFINWICSVSEFTFLYTTIYTEAIDKKCSNTIKMVTDTFHKLIVLGFSSWSSKTLILMDPSIDGNLYSKERFCTIMSMFVSHRFFPMGCLSIEDLGQINDGSHNNVVYGKDLPPNYVVITSDEHITAKFFIKHLKNG